MLLRNKPWNRSLQVLLTAIIAFNFLPHIFSVPIWVSAVGLGCVVWKLLYLMRGAKLPKKSLLTLSAMIGGACVFLSVPLPFNSRAASAMLVILAGFKLLESNQYRDAMLIIFSSYFLLLLHLLNTPTLGATLFMIFDLYIITLLLFHIHFREERFSRKFFKPPWRLTRLALPLCMFLFVAFPRFSIGNWKANDSTADIGFADKLDPGAIGNLISSNKTAFRAHFSSNQQPAAISMYWRGAILTLTDGFRWRKESDEDTDEQDQTVSELVQQSFNYDVWLEGGAHKSIFALDYPEIIIATDALLKDHIQKKPGFIYESSRPIVSRVYYSARSVIRPPTQKITNMQFKELLQLPNDLDQKVIDHASELRKQADILYRKTITDKEDRYARQIMDWFVDSKFRYTRTPDPVGSGSGPAQLTAFLFQKRRGFCEHFASSFAILMRAMGVPTRVVAGFHGGVQNEVGNYWVVRHRDAHAWAEFWRSDSKNPLLGRWVRVDPTERIAPLRLQLGGDYYSVDASALAEGLTQEEINQLMQSGLSGTLRKIQNTWDVMQVRWNNFLTKYDFDFQAKIMKKIGLGDLDIFSLAEIVSVTVFSFIGFVGWRMKKKAKREDRTLRNWRRFCLTLEKCGIKKRSNEGAQDFAQRATSLLPARSSEIKSIAATFIEIRYGQYSTTSQSKRLKKMIREFASQIKAENKKASPR